MRITPADAADFIRANTAIASPPLLPEIRLHLATMVTPLWQATEASLAEQGLPPPYWAFAWAGGQALARHVLDRPDCVRGRRVLDFGAGSGMVAIAAARAGAARIAAAEIDHFACAAIGLNAALNDAAITIVEEDMIDRALRADVVLVGDMCYERPLAERLVRWLRAAAGRGVTVGGDRVVQPPFLFFGPFLFLGIIFILVVREFRAYRRRAWLRSAGYPPYL